jgi:hypothetical protein
LVTNIAISIHGKKGTDFKTPLDFFLDWDLEKGKAPVKTQSPEDMLNVFKAIASGQKKNKERDAKIKARIEYREKKKLELKEHQDKPVSKKEEK